MSDCYCGAECWVSLADMQEEFGSCSGFINVTNEEYDDEDYYWIHSCEGHEDDYWRLYK